jgi:hypothetical protein
MTPRRLNAAVCAVVALSVGVAVNVTFFQRGTVANWAVRGAVRPVAVGANTEARLETSAHPSDSTLTCRQCRPDFGVGGHDGRPSGGIANATPSPHPGITGGDVGRTAEGASTFTASNEVDVIRAVQQELGRRGYKPGIPNGMANVATRRAIMAYQHDHGLPLTGEPSDALLKAIVFESTGAVRTPGNAIGKEQANHEVPIIRAIKPRPSTWRASQRTTQVVSRRCAGAGRRASRSTCERRSLARAKEPYGTVVPSVRVAIDAARFSTGWTASPRVDGREMTTSSTSAQRPTTSSRARKPTSEEKHLNPAAGSSGLESPIWTQFSTYRPLATAVPPRVRPRFRPVPNSPLKFPDFPDVIR